MKMLCSTMVDKLYKKYQKVFPSPKIEQGIAYVEDVEDVPVRDNIFHGCQLAFCENVPPQTDYYRIFIVFQKKHYQFDSEKMFSKHTEVRIEYIQKIGDIQILRILKKDSNFEN